MSASANFIYLKYSIIQEYNKWSNLEVTVKCHSLTFFINIFHASPLYLFCPKNLALIKNVYFKIMTLMRVLTIRV